MPDKHVKQALLIDHWPGSEPICGSGLGSSLFKLAAATDAVSAGWQLDLITAPEKVSLLKGTTTYHKVADTISIAACDAYDRIIILGITPPKNLSSQANTRMDIGRYADPVEEKKYYNTLPHVTYWRTRLASALGFSISNAPVEFDLCLRQEEITRATKRLSGKTKWIAIAIQALSNLKQFHQWSKVSRLLGEAHPEMGIVWLGDQPASNSFLDGKHPAFLNLCGKTNLRELMAILNQCSLIVGSDGLITNLGLALKRPTVALFSIIDPQFVAGSEVVGDRPFIAMVKEGCPQQFCYPQLENYRTSPCPLEPELADGVAVTCMRFRPEEIVVAASGLLN